MSYGARTIQRARCVRCGASANHQWQACADRSYYRALCTPCDIGLNGLILRWMRDPQAREKLHRYRRELLETTR